MRKLLSNQLIILPCFLILFTNHNSHLLRLQEKSPTLKVLPIYEEAENKDEYLWIPSGWMPDGAGIVLQDNYKENCHSGETCIKVGYNSEQNSWVGIYWLPNGEWKDPGINIYEKLNVDKNASVVLTFWARGEKGGEKAQFKVGGVSDGNDSIEFPVETEWIALSEDWKQYTIDLTNQDLSNVVGGFCWVTNKSKNRGREIVRIFLDDIRFKLKNSLDGKEEGQ